ncbi:coiled coils domain protein [Pacmanvirus S19]|nr:coiled coils domain protein [Pacmanvirus S19]
MGGSSSKTIVNQLSEQINNISTDVVQECIATIDQDQNLEVINTGFKFWGSYKLQQTSEIKQECFNSVEKQTELQNKIFAAISQASTATGVGIISAFGSSSSYAETNLKSIIRNNVTMSNIQKAYNQIKVSQTAKFSNSGVIGFEKVELTQGAKIFAAATLETIDKAGIFNQISSHVDQSSTADTSSPLNIFGGLSSMIKFAVLFIIIAIAIAIGGPKLMSFIKPQESNEMPQEGISPVNEQ